MNDPLFDAEDDAATPLTPDERAQLIPTYITTRAQLNEAEQIGIADADRWAFRRKRDVLDEDFLLALHKRMLGGVWQWAGTFRNTERNIGIAAYRRCAVRLPHGPFQIGQQNVARCIMIT